MGRLTDDQKALRNDPEWLEAQAWGIGYSREAALEEAARLDGMALGYAFRAAELRYDARGGMTAALERRRFEPGARWSLYGEEHTIEQADDSGLERHLCSAEDLTLHWERIDRMTRANGWLFLGLSDQGGYR